MKLAVSNIAWQPADDAAMATVLANAGLEGVEIAPTKRWPDPPRASDDELRDYRAWWEERGLRIVSMQSLLFGRDDLTIFESDTSRSNTLAYLQQIITLGAGLGAGALVFGSPKNRRRGAMPAEEAQRVAVAFFAMIGRAAEASGTVFCLEPNPAQYGCDFLTTSAECVAFLEEVGSPGLGLHLDSAAMTMSEEGVAEAIARASAWLRHFHVSEPYLAPIGTGGVDHPLFARSLAASGYEGWVSIEMRAVTEPVIAVADAIGWVSDAYEPVLA